MNFTPLSKMSEQLTFSKDTVFSRIDALVDQLEDEGYELRFVVEVMKEFVEICDDYLL